ncbi:MAG: hypothetical protein GVY11_04890 [Gammaproteobacteria bacterium]|jgi:hypothetical protein|nr:hypothetical protein [Gammaproteobacteria bacterium]
MFRMNLRLFVLLFCWCSMAGAWALDAVPGEWQTFGGVSAGCNGTIYESVEADDGSIYFGGEFSVCGDVAANNVVAYDPAANQFEALGEGVNRAVYDLAVVGSDLYVGGAFFEAGGQSASYLARWDGSQWHAMGEFSSRIWTLLWHDGILYAGGDFSEVDGTAASRVAQWDGTSWSALGAGVEDTAYALAWWDGRLYVGGRFSQAGGAPASRIASWAPGDWQALAGSSGDDGIDNPFSPVVFALAAADEGVYVGGQFELAGGAEANDVAFWDGAWSSLESNGFNGFSSGNVRDIHRVGGDLYFAGTFSSAGGVALNRLARWDGSQWHPVGTASENGVDAFTYTVLVVDGEVYAGGVSVHRAGSKTVSHVARWTGSEWTVLGPDDQGGVGGPVNAVLRHEGDLIVAGDFGLAGTTPARHIARWDGNDWHPLGSEALSGEVTGLAVWQGELVAIGRFFRVGTRIVRFAARWDGNQWQALGAGFNSPPHAVMADGSELCVGGSSFLESDGVPVGGTACWDGSVWQPLGDGVNGFVEAMVGWNGQIIAAGSFTEAGGQAANRIAAWDGSDWSPLGTPPDDGVNRPVLSLLADQGSLYVGGDFFNVAGDSQLFLARWDGSGWSNPADEVNSRINALANSPLGLVAGGRFRNVFAPGGFEPLRRVGLWNGSAWRTLGSGLDAGVSGDVHTLDASTGAIVVGGEFGQAGGALSAGIAIYRVQDSLFSDRFRQ